MNRQIDISVEQLGGGSAAQKQVSATNSTGRGLTSSVEDRALVLLGQGIEASVVASALGVSAGRISQLLSNEEFSRRVVELRFKTLAEQTQRDDRYDRMEDSLLDKLESHLPFMIKTADILRAIQVVNNAKRRGQATPDMTAQAERVVTLLMPMQVVQTFTAEVNVMNQVVKVGETDLVTIQSNTLLNQVREQKKLEAKVNEK